MHEFLDLPVQNLILEYDVYRDGKLVNSERDRHMNISRRQALTIAKSRGVVFTVDILRYKTSVKGNRSGRK